MKDKDKQKTKQNTVTADKKKLLYTLMSVVLIAALIAGLTYAWFFSQSNMATLLSIKAPSDISILGPDGSEMSSIDLNYSAGDVSDGKVTVRRVFCVQNAEDAHRLEIVHTTNMKGLTFQLYKVTNVTEGSTGGANSVTENGKTYTYNATPLTGNYINQDKKSSADYKYATNTYHDKNYGEYSDVQTHAEPVYWLAEGTLSSNTKNTVTIKDKIYYNTYYVCEVSWTETTKETDIFYILAENATAGTDH